MTNSSQSHQSRSTSLRYSMRPTFLIGCHRSGTTLLRYILDAHDRIACPPETKLLTALSKVLCHPQTVPAMRSLGVSRTQILMEMGVAAARILESYAIRKSKQRWIDKTPNYYAIIDQIDEMFALEAQYLFLVRHPFDSIISLEEFFGNPSEFHGDPDIVRVAFRYGYGRIAWVNYWREVNERIIFAMSHLGARALLIRYEDLVSHPHGTIHKVLHFLDEPEDDDLIEKAFKVIHDDGFQDSKIRQARDIYRTSVCRGWSAMNEQERAVVWQIVGNLAGSFGYTSSSSGLVG